MRIDHVSSGRSIPQCKECTKKLHRENEPHRFSIEKIRPCFTKYGATLITTVYINAKQKLEFKCACSKLGLVSWDKIQKGQAVRCKGCQFLYSYKRGSDHPQFDSNISDQERALKLLKNRGPDWYRFSNSLLKKVNYICQLCAKRGSYLSAHHKYNWADYPDKRFDPDNIVVICREHHLEFHSLYGYGNNTPDQFLEYASKFKEDL